MARVPLVSFLTALFFIQLEICTVGIWNSNSNFLIRFSPQFCLNFSLYIHRISLHGLKRRFSLFTEEVLGYCFRDFLDPHELFPVAAQSERKAHLMEIQVNGATIAQKVDFAYGFFEKQVPVDVVFMKDERIDIIGVIQVMKVL
ncbi:hypothetical protein R3W88_024944 [Solanum pinnatisectum]|uniref:Uncharacterized protein n=1 Tax=Solanum pinnatisectum TaxID=50273 RepID=A0AAV9M247_9SOLN|nr:hypothetical protein R3W88_024944 [Solanum pinnatisectum]